MRRDVLPAIVLAAAAAACSDDPTARAPDAKPRAQTPMRSRTETVKQSPFADAPMKPRGRWPEFTDVTQGSGLESFTLHAGVEKPKHWLLEAVGSGLAAFDYDGDGDMDLLLVDGDGMSPDGEIVDLPGSGARLYRNDGKLRFTDVTKGSGLESVTGFGLAAACCDYDADGDVDVLIAGYGLLHLLRNRGDGTFEDVAKAAGVVGGPWDLGAGAAWGDLNGDGLPDLYVANYVDQRKQVELTRSEKHPDPRFCKWRGHTVLCGPRGLTPLMNRLFFQKPDHTFEDVTKSNLKEDPRFSFQCVMTDVDDDGDLDVFVANDSIDRTLSMNDGRGFLEDKAIESGVAHSTSFTPQGSMGAAVADFDRDGRMDLAATNFAYEYNVLYRNETKQAGRASFRDVSLQSNFSRQPLDRVCWGLGLVDFDLDGELDCFIAAGHVYPEEELDKYSTFTFYQRNQILRGVGPPQLKFEDLSDKSGAHFQDKRLWRGAVFPDLDDDGDLDVVVQSQHHAPAVLRNDCGAENGWIRFRLRGRAPNTDAPGARVTITLPDGSSRTSELHLGSSFASCDDPRIHFGVGAARSVSKAVIRWPNGEKTTLTDLAVRKSHDVKQ